MSIINTQSNVALINSGAASRDKITPNISPDVGNVSSELTKTTLTLSADASVVDEDENAQYTLPPLVITRIKSSEQQGDIYMKEMQEFGVDTMNTAGSVLITLNREMVALQNKIEAVKPDILGKKWDFVLNNGKVEITGTNLQQEDKQWLENTLNRNKTVMTAATDFYASVVKRYEHTQDHPSSFDTENGKSLVAYGVDEQINGKLEIRSIMDQIVARNKTRTGNEGNPFIDSLEIVRSKLKMTDQVTYYHNMADMSDPATAAYYKENPGFQ